MRKLLLLNIYNYGFDSEKEVLISPNNEAFIVIKVHVLLW